MLVDSAVFFMKDKLGKTPVFLMDDVFGEIDMY
jgi:recombinational DNA repair ATPase RecF